MFRLIALVLLLAAFYGVTLGSSAQEGETATTTPSPRPTPSSTVTVDGVTLELLFEQIPQGRAALLNVYGEGVAGARLRFLDQLADFFPGDDGSFYGFLVADMDLSPRVYEISVFAWREDGSRVTVPAQVEVVLGGFLRQEIGVSPDRAYLIDPQVERVEYARLSSMFGTFTPEKLWGSGGFQYPMDVEMISAFGAYRTVNQTIETRHTGWDFRAPSGTPVMATASGRVAYAGQMDIRGNYIFIDHGYGVFSGYAHLSEIHVTRGQTVTRGQIIGVSGNSGRSSGAHFHWEITVNGEWVDSRDFVEMWLP